MNIENMIEQELVFKVEIKNKKNNQKKVVKVAGENLTKMMMDRLTGRTGEC